MIVRIKLAQGRAPRNMAGKNRQLALAFASLLIPASLMAYVLGFWRLTSDLRMTREFAIGGLFSHWQIWIFLGVTMHVASSGLSRYGRGGEFHLPRVLMVRFGVAAHPPDDPNAAPGVSSGVNPGAIPSVSPGASPDDRPHAKAS